MPDIYLFVDGQQTGPFSLAQVRQLLAEGKVSAETPAWHKDLTEWSTLAAVLAKLPPEGPPPPVYATTAPSVAPASAPLPATAKKGMSGCLVATLIGVALCLLCLPGAAILAGIALGPITAGIQKAKESAAIQEARAIDLTMFAYATDHNGAYPAGKTSTEVFQKLIDEKYVSDPGMFYLPMPGKIRATSNTLTAENVCFDVTGGVTSDSPDDMPLVFSTGFTVTYSAGAEATRDASHPGAFPGVAVAYKNNSALFKKIFPDGSVPNFIPADFDSGGKTYQQLRP